MSKGEQLFKPAYCSLTYFGTAYCVLHNNITTLCDIVYIYL